MLLPLFPVVFSNSRSPKEIHPTVPSQGSTRCTRAGIFLLFLGRCYRLSGARTCYRNSILSRTHDVLVFVRLFLRQRLEIVGVPLSPDPPPVFTSFSVWNHSSTLKYDFRFSSFGIGSSPFLFLFFHSPSGP